ncbi:AAA family ATPase [Pseudomonas viridiflava]|uniref:AAA family ATPase n=1 Tax=Pseudomonas viridiflava TaxID=33069 RepID=UPI000F02AA32|nr:ATP-binding protein [Pseudomonas viridiflava]
MLFQERFPAERDQPIKYPALTLSSVFFIRNAALKMLLNALQSRTAKLFLVNLRKSDLKSEGNNVIVDFTVKNFRSLRDEAVLSMHVENPKKHLIGNISYPLDDRLGLLRTAAIYGANASGKSNVLLALSALKWIIRESGSLKEGASLDTYEPFLMSPSTREAPITFEIEFVIPGDYRYVYEISYTRNKIVYESLDFYPSRQKANIFLRKEDDTWETISFGSHYKGGSKKIPIFNNNSYLSAAGNNAATPKIIKTVYNYFKKILTMNSSKELPVGDLYESDMLLKCTSVLLRLTDTGVTNITKKESNLDALRSLSESMPQNIRDSLLSKHKFEFSFTHESEDGESFALPLAEESEGTQQLFRLLPIILTTFMMGGTLVIDEIESNFHPHIAELIIDLFNNPEVNTQHSQLIFSTHDTQLMSPKHLRRDQIWFTSKVKGASTLSSLDEYDKETVTAASPYNNWYNEGRFGAVPIIKHDKISRFISQLVNAGDNEEIDITELLSGKEDKANA